MDVLKVLNDLEQQIERVPKIGDATDSIRYLFREKKKEIKQEIANEQAQRVGNKQNEE